MRGAPSATRGGIAEGERERAEHGRGAERRAERLARALALALAERLALAESGGLRVTYMLQRRVKSQVVSSS
jgi:hypothetical protein